MENCQINTCFLSAVLLALLSACAVPASGAPVARIETWAAKTYPFSDPDPVPCVGAKRYPYCRFDGSTDAGVTQDWQTVVLENGRIRVKPVPAVGGKVWGATDLRTGTDFIYDNHVVKFRDVAARGPWTSGGIEFNFGIGGHGPYTSLPVDWTVRENGDGSVSYFCGLTEMICRTTWQVEVRLPASGSAFETRTVWYNGSGVRTPYYQWMNAGFGVKRENPEFVFPGKNYIGHEGDAHPWPVEDGHRISVYSNNAFGVTWGEPRSADHKSYHVINGDNRFFGVWWPKAGLGAYHLNAADEKYGRKIWLWGLSRAGGIWEDLLTDTDGQYVELQSGRCFQQPSGKCWQTPFAHSSFVPGTTDTFVEKWGFVRDRADLDRQAQDDLGAARPTEFPKDFDWDGAYGLWLKAKEAIFAGLRQGGVRKGLYKDNAEELLKASLAKDPCFSKSLVTLGGLLIEAGRTDEALVHLDKALAVDTYDAEANYLEGLVALESGQLLRARERLGLAAYSPEFRAAALTLLAKTFAREGKWLQAFEAAERALAANAAERDAQWLLCVALRKSGRAELAKGVLATARNEFPLSHIFCYETFKLGLEKDFKANVRNHAPDETYMDMAGLYESVGLKDEAAELYACAPKSIVAAIRRAHLNRDVAALQEASKLSVAFAFPFRREAQPALRWAADNGAGWKFRYLFALWLNAKGRRAEGDALLKRCGDAPDAAEFYIYRASHESGAAAHADLRRAAEIADGWRVALGRFRLYASEENWTAARDMLAEYMKRYPENPGLALGYARALVKTGANAKAVAFLECIRFLPSELGERPLPVYQEALVALADAALAKGDEAAAIGFVRKALNPPESLGSGRPFSWDRVVGEWPARVRALCPKVR